MPTKPTKPLTITEPLTPNEERRAQIKKAHEDGLDLWYELLGKRVEEATTSDDVAATNAAAKAAYEDAVKVQQARSTKARQDTVDAESALQAHIAKVQADIGIR